MKETCGLKGNPGSGLFQDLPKLLSSTYAAWKATEALLDLYSGLQCYGGHTVLQKIAVLQKILFNSFTSRMPLKFKSLITALLGVWIILFVTENGKALVSTSFRCINPAK